MSVKKRTGLRGVTALAMVGLMTVATPAFPAVAEESTQQQEAIAESTVDSVKNTHRELSNGQEIGGTQVSVKDISPDVLESVYTGYTDAVEGNEANKLNEANQPTFKNNKGVQALYIALHLAYESSNWANDSRGEHGLYIDGAEISTYSSTGDTDMTAVGIGDMSTGANVALTYTAFIASGGPQHQTVISEDFPESGDPAKNAGSHFSDKFDRDEETAVVWREVFEKRDMDRTDREGIRDREVVNHYGDAALELLAMWDNGITDVEQYSQGIDGLEEAVSTSGNENEESAQDSASTTPATTENEEPAPDSDNVTPADGENEGAAQDSASTTTPDAPSETLAPETTTEESPAETAASGDDSLGDSAESGTADTPASTTSEAPVVEEDAAGVPEAGQLDEERIGQLLSPSGTGSHIVPTIEGEYSYSGNGKWHVRGSMSVTEDNIVHYINPGDRFTVVSFAKRIPGQVTGGTVADSYEDATWVVVKYMDENGQEQLGLVVTDMFYSVEE